MSEPSISVESICGHVKIYINAVLHLQFKRSNLAGMQAWIEDGGYYIEFTLADHNVITSDYDRREMWKQILQGIDELYR